MFTTVAHKNGVVDQPERADSLDAATLKSTTYGEIVQQAINFAVSLTHMGVRKGDVIGLASENREEFWGAMIGEFKNAVNLSKPKLLICSPFAYKNQAETINSLTLSEKIILFGNERVNNTILYKDLAVDVKEKVRYEQFRSVDVNGQTDTFPNVHTVLQGYGSSETTLGVIMFKFDESEAAKRKPGSVGRVVTGMIVKIGEICVKGAMLMKGYVGIGRGDDFDDEGFYKTGDVGYYDDERFFYVVFPTKLEALLLTHSSVNDVGVIGIPHESGGEVPLAFVVVQPASDVTEKELQEFVAERVSDPEQLRGGVRFVDKIPKSPAGKILRKELKALLKPLDASTLKSTTYGEIVQQSMNFAVSLTHMGVRKGDVVGLISENREEFWGAVIGVACTGATLATICPIYVKEEFKNALNLSKPKYLICSPFAYKNHAETINSLALSEKFIKFGNERVHNTILYKDLAVDVNEQVRYEEFKSVDVDGQTDTLFIIYSSGTTGLPKGVMLTHLNVITSCSLLEESEMAKRKPGSVGRVIPGMSIKDYFCVS
ncbi:AMP dependent coa ligase [Operophtera brumata]|uniref:AMP dependent coa ligase n=1 Tax=Operophtera brumata TaxID=104452 RepID=A0A0L7L8I0_OPEBR|nr:AMP dependent coa ligase [Operophtera brumata]